MKTVTRKQLIDMQPCDLDERLEMFGKHESMNIKQAFEAGFTVYDILWICGELDLKTVIVEFANGCGDAAARAADAAADAAAARAADAAAHYAAYYAADAAAHYAAYYAARAADDTARAARAADAAADAAARAAAAAADAAAERDRQRKHLIELLTDDV